MNDFTWHCKRVREDEIYRKSCLVDKVKVIFAKHSEGGIMQRGSMRAFLKELWGIDFGDVAEKQWEAMDAYDESYDGIKYQDFIELRHYWDECAIKAV